MTTPQIYRKLDRQIANSEKLILAQYKIALDETRVKLSIIYEKYSTDGVLTYAEMAKYGRLTALEKDLMKTFNAKNAGVVAELKRIPDDIYNSSFLNFAYKADSGLHIRLNWGLVPQQAVEDIVNNPLSKIARDSLTKNQRTRISRALAQGFLQGVGYPEMAREIKKVYGRTAYEAIRVARTEGQKAATAGQRATYDRSVALGIETNLFWDAYNQPKRTRHNHLIMNEKKAQMHKGVKMFYYSPTGQWVHRPMDPVLPGGEIINCRCRLREELVEVPEDIKTDYPDISFEEWQKEAKIR